MKARSFIFLLMVLALLDLVASLLLGERLGLLLLLETDLPLPEPGFLDPLDHDLGLLLLAGLLGDLLPLGVGVLDLLSCSDDGHLFWVLVLDLSGVDDVHVSCPLLHDDHDRSGGDHVDALQTLHGPCEDPFFLPWLSPWLSSL